jgi:2-amino-4-hydroxy-6-hydroxymethyldihydropteridine diphosphokinase
MPIIYLSLGSNLGNREQNLIKVNNFISEDIGEIVARSSIYENEAVAFDGNDFFNQVLKVETCLSPESLLQKTQEIEIKVGRERKTVIKNGTPIYSNRIIDIDILLYDDIQIDSETLTIPHPRMYERGFVMKPLKEVIGD